MRTPAEMKCEKDDVRLKIWKIRFIQQENDDRQRGKIFAYYYDEVKYIFLVHHSLYE